MTMVNDGIKQDCHLIISGKVQKNFFFVYQIIFRFILFRFTEQI